MIERITFGRQSTDIPIAAPILTKMEMLQAAGIDSERAGKEESVSVQLTP